MAATASIIAAIPDLEGKFSGRSTRRASLSPAKAKPEWIEHTPAPLVAGIPSVTPSAWEHAHTKGRTWVDKKNEWGGKARKESWQPLGPKEFGRTGNSSAAVNGVAALNADHRTGRALEDLETETRAAQKKVGHNVYFDDHVGDDNKIEQKIKAAQAIYASSPTVDHIWPGCGPRYTKMTKKFLALQAGDKGFVGVRRRFTLRGAPQGRFDIESARLEKKIKSSKSAPAILTEEDEEDDGDQSEVLNRAAMSSSAKALKAKHASLQVKNTKKDFDKFEAQPKTWNQSHPSLAGVRHTGASITGSYKPARHQSVNLHLSGSKTPHAKGTFWQPNAQTYYEPATPPRMGMGVWGPNPPPQCEQRKEEIKAVYEAFMKEQKEVRKIRQNFAYGAAPYEVPELSSEFARSTLRKMRAERDIVKVRVSGIPSGRKKKQETVSAQVKTDLRDHSAGIEHLKQSAETTAVATEITSKVRLSMVGGDILDSARAMTPDSGYVANKSKLIKEQRAAAEADRASSRGSTRGPSRGSAAKERL